MNSIWSKGLWQIRSYLLEVLRQITSYLPEDLRQISSYLPEDLRQITSSFYLNRIVLNVLVSNYSEVFKLWRSAQENKDLWQDLKEPNP